MTNATAQETSQQPQPDKDLAEIVEGLSQPQKRISPKYFYDERGSKLFEVITEQPEYYPTRTELGILNDNIGEIGAALGDGVSLIEFGAGASVKVRVLLDNLPGIEVFVPVDISGEHLQLAVDELSYDHPDVEMLPVAADFTRPFDLPTPKKMPKRNVVFFPGSTIGNFPPKAALDLLRTMRGVAKEGGALLIGVDLKKDPAVLERAYNDAAGVTAAFNLNMLQHINERFAANFQPAGFEHRAIYNEEEGRIEMHLISRCAQSVDIGGHHFTFESGEYVLSECSHKYTLAEFEALAAEAGFRVAQVWTDADEHFSVQYCESV